MKRSDAILLAIGALLLTAVLLVTTGCKTSYEAESASHATAAETLDTDRQVDKHVVDAPDRTTTTIEEFAPDGPLVKRTTTVAEHGAVVTDTRVDAKSQERADSVVDEQRREKRTFDFLHSPFTLLGGLVVLAGLAYVAWRLFKPRLLP